MYEYLFSTVRAFNSALSGRETPYHLAGGNRFVRVDFRGSPPLAVYFAKYAATDFLTHSPLTCSFDLSFACVNRSFFLHTSIPLIWQTESNMRLHWVCN